MKGKHGRIIYAPRLRLSAAECLTNLGHFGTAQEIAKDILRSDNINAYGVYARGLCSIYNNDNVVNAAKQIYQVLLCHQFKKL